MPETVTLSSPIPRTDFDTSSNSHTLSFTEGDPLPPLAVIFNKSPFLSSIKGHSHSTRGQRTDWRCHCHTRFPLLLIKPLFSCFIPTKIKAF